MKQLLIFTGTLWMLLCSAEIASAQIPGQKYVFVNAGTVNGFLLRNNNNLHYFHVEAGYSTINKSRGIWSVSAGYMQKEFLYGMRRIPVAQFTVESGYGRTLFKDRKEDLGFNLHASALAGYETTN